MLVNLMCMWSIVFMIHMVVRTDHVMKRADCGATQDGGNWVAHLGAREPTLIRGIHILCERGNLRLDSDDDSDGGNDGIYDELS